MLLSRLANVADEPPVSEEVVIQSTVVEEVIATSEDIEVRESNESVDNVSAAAQVDGAFDDKVHNSMTLMLQVDGAADGDDDDDDREVAMLMMTPVGLQVDGTGDEDAGLQPQQQVRANPNMPPPVPSPQLQQQQHGMYPGMAPGVNANVNTLPRQMTPPLQRTGHSPHPVAMGAGVIGAAPSPRPVQFTGMSSPLPPSQSPHHSRTGTPAASPMGVGPQPPGFGGSQPSTPQMQMAPGGGNGGYSFPVVHQQPGVNPQQQPQQQMVPGGSVQGTPQQFGGQMPSSASDTLSHLASLSQYPQGGQPQQQQQQPGMPNSQQQQMMTQQQQQMMPGNGPNVFARAPMGGQMQQVQMHPGQPQQRMMVMQQQQQPMPGQQQVVFTQIPQRQPYLPGMRPSQHVTADGFVMQVQQPGSGGMSSEMMVAANGGAPQQQQMGVHHPGQPVFLQGMPPRQAVLHRGPVGMRPVFLHQQQASQQPQSQQQFGTMPAPPPYRSPPRLMRGPPGQWIRTAAGMIPPGMAVRGERMPYGPQIVVGADGSQQARYMAPQRVMLMNMPPQQGGAGGQPPMTMTPDGQQQAQPGRHFTTEQPPLMIQELIEQVRVRRFSTVISPLVCLR
jgi:hypothetical protein